MVFKKPKGGEFNFFFFFFQLQKFYDFKYFDFTFVAKQFDSKTSVISLQKIFPIMQIFLIFFNTTVDIFPTLGVIITLIITQSKSSEIII